MESFNNEFDKMVAVGALVELTEEDRQSWKGDVQGDCPDYRIKDAPTCSTGAQNPQ